MKAERETLHLTPDVAHSRKDIVSVSIGRKKKIQIYSVRAWRRSYESPMVSNEVSAEVNRWWIIKAKNNRYWPYCAYIVGYLITDPLVVSVDDDWRVYHMGEAKERKPP